MSDSERPMNDPATERQRRSESDGLRGRETQQDGASRRSNSTDAGGSVQTAGSARRGLPSRPQQQGAVYDRGYRPYDGPRGGRSEARLALWKSSMRRALGLRRSWRQKVFPWTLLAIVSVPAIVNIGIAYLARDTVARGFEFITYREYAGVSTALLLFVALTAPDVICPDRRHRVLPLIFARPLTGTDYILTKVAAIGSIVFAFGFLPQVLLFVGIAFVDDGGSLNYVRDNAEVMWQVPLAVALIALYYSVLGIFFSTLTTRRVIAGATFLVVLLVSSVVAAVLGGGSETGLDDSLWSVANLLSLPLRIRDLVFLGEMDPRGSLGGVEGGGVAAVVTYTVVVGSALAFLVHRHRWIET